MKRHSKLLGGLLVSGLSRARHKTRRSKVAPRVPKRRRRIMAWRGAAVRPEPLLRPHEEKASLPAPSPIPQSVTPRGLLTSDLARPGEALRRSIEGFLLDQRSEHTRRAYGKDLHRFTKYLLVRGMERGMETLDRSVLIAYKDALLSEGLQHTTIDRHLATLRSFFQWLVDDGAIARSPAEGVRFLNPKRLSPTQGFSDAEVRKILELPNIHTRTGAQHYAILMILFYCGLRRSEVCALRTSSLSVERGHTVMKLRGKGNAERLIPLIPAVAGAVEHHLRMSRREREGDAWLFRPIKNNRGGGLDKPIDPSLVFYLVTKYAKEAGVANRVSPHSCRATAISNARDHHVPDRAIQEFAGWSSTQMITRYDKRRTSVEESAAHAIQYHDDNEPG